MTEPFFGATDTGRLRTNNEDAFFAQRVLNGQFVAACVIDGVGGYEGGEVAAQMAHDTILDYFRIPSGEVAVMMKEALAAANEKIFRAKKEKPHLESMACVLTLALADSVNNQFYFAHIGDTRLYLLRDDTLVKVTKDQSFVGFLEDSGRLSEEAAMNHPKRNEIDRALGFEAFGAHSDYVETGFSPFLPGDLLLLCSDGLTDLVDSRTITGILQEDTSLEEKCSALIDAANSKGGKDNITVVLVLNDKAPVKQRATKPKKPKAAALKKNSSPQEAIAEAPKEPPPPLPVRKEKSNRAVISVLSVLCLLFLSGFIWMWWQLQKEETVALVTDSEPTAPVVKMSNPQEQRLWDSLNNHTRGVLTLQDSLFGKTIVLSDTLLLNDSLHLKGNGIALQADSAFGGPAFVVPATARYIILDNLVLRNFDIGILAQSKGVRLRNVRFQNCRIPVQYQLRLPDSVAINGSLTDLISRRYNERPPNEQEP